MKLLCLLLFFLLPTALFAQSAATPALAGYNLYITPNAGHTRYARERDPHLSGGLAAALQKGSHLFSVRIQTHFEFGPETPAGNDTEYALSYGYIYRPFASKTLFIGAGAGIGLVHITEYFDTRTEELNERVQSGKLFIPLELTIGFLYPDNGLRLLQLTLYRNYNSIIDYYGWRLGFNFELF